MVIREKELGTVKVGFEGESSSIMGEDHRGG